MGISKDTITCNLTMRTVHKRKDGLFECPISGLTANGKYKFIVLRQCGCVLSERTLKNIKGEKCSVCNVKMDKTINDWTHIPINPSMQRKDQMFKEMMRRKNKRKNKKNEQKNAVSKANKK